MNPNGRTLVHEGSETHWSQIDAALAGDDGAQAALHTKYKGPVLAYLRARGFPNEAEDLAQEVFLRLFCSGVLQRADARKGRFRSLLLAVTRNVSGDHLKHIQAKKRSGRMVPLQVEGDQQAAPAARDPEAVFEREWHLNLLEVSLARLAAEHPHYHEAIRLFMLEGLSRDDVAARLERSPTDVRNHVHRGKLKLMAYLREEVWTTTPPDEFAAELRRVSRFVEAAGEA